MAAGESIATITIFGAIVLVIILIINSIFFLNQDRGFIDWLKYVISKHIFVTILEVVFFIFSILQFISIFLII